jgi:hypothetical protein
MQFRRTEAGLFDFVTEKLRFILSSRSLQGMIKIIDDIRDLECLHVAFPEHKPETNQDGVKAAGALVCCSTN